jgi:3-hydroxybutyryl-CoA dehydrogenase
MRDLNKLAVIGAGTMGRRIAYGCVTRGKVTRLFDISPEILDGAVREVTDLARSCSQDGHVSKELAAASGTFLSSASSLEECVSGADLVIESVSENVRLKREVIQQIALHCDGNTLISTNTSSIPGSWLADVTRHPENFFNANFGGMEDLKVEIMGHSGTCAATLRAAVQFIRDIGLVPVVVNGESLGYATNRIWRAVKKEVLHVLDGGYITPADLDRAWMLDWNTSIGPCGVMDKIGLDIVRDIEMIYFEASGDPNDRPPAMLLNMIAAGKLGAKSGEGFYKYPNPVYRDPDWLAQWQWGKS